MRACAKTFFATMRTSIMCWRFQAMPNEWVRLGGALMLIAGIMVAAPAAMAAEAVEQDFDCVIDPSETAKLGSPVAGILAKVLVKRGDIVSRGQDVAELESRLEAANVAYDRLRAQSVARIDAQKLRLDLAAARLQRASELVARNVVTEDKFEELRADAGVAQQDLLREQQDQKLAELDVGRSEALLEQRTIRSPLDGIVIEKKLSAGEFVNQEGYVVAIARLDPLYVETYLPVSTYGQIHIGSAGTVYPDPPIGGAYRAAVIVVDRVFDPSSGTYGVRLELANLGSKLPAGQRCRVGFSVATAEQKTSTK
jgi:RND family efflux transporter MFP subunit